MTAYLIGSLPLAVFPAVSIPWWVWALVLLATLAVVGFSILIRPESETPKEGGEGLERKAHVAPQTAEIPAKKMEVKLPEQAEVASRHVELPEPDLLMHDETESAGDDLKRINGITPGVVSVLYTAGIRSYGDLAGSSADRLEKVLRSAGIRNTNPKNWPEQARLAGEGKWDELKHFGEGKGG